MARRIIKLSDFDPYPIVEYAITERDLTIIHQYLRAMQSHLGVATWDEIGLGSYYGTSALLHEVVELRILLNRDPYLLTRSTEEIKAFARLPTNRDAHVRGLEVEYGYLQKVIEKVMGRHINIGALLLANTKRPGDWQDLFDTNLPFFEPTEEEIEEAEEILTRLRTLGRRQR
jgi:hypothetical protein